MNSYLIFNEAHPTRAKIVASARSYIGVMYSYRGSRITTDPATGQKSGFVDCIRLMFYVARDVGYLPADFDVNLTRPDKTRTLDECMYEVLHANLDKVLDAKPNEGGSSFIKPGDLFLMRYTDVDRNINDVHHVAIVTDRSHMVHAIDHTVTYKGSVVEQRISALDWQRVESVWRMRGVVD